MYLAAFQPQKALAQARIHGSVLDKNKRPVAMANVLLLQAKDSTLIRGMVTTVSGAYSFMNVPAGTYIISASFVGYRQASTAPFPIRDIPDDKDMGTIELPWEDKQLDKVTIIAKKPLFEQTIDRLTINVENSITAAGSTALDILERSPGIVVDLQNAVLSMNGKNSVVVMINGKINHMPSWTFDSDSLVDGLKWWNCIRQLKFHSRFQLLSYRSPIFHRDALPQRDLLKTRIRRFINSRSKTV